jgi:hypothetical protein
MVAHVEYSVAGRSRGRVAPCAVCTMHVETRSVCFLVKPQKQGRRFVSGLVSKSLGRFVSGLVLKSHGWFVNGFTSKSLGQFSPVWPQNWWRQFLAVWPQNLLRRFLTVWPENLLHDFCRFGLKICYDGLTSKPVVRVSLFVPQNR